MQNSGWGLPRSVERGPDKSRSAFMDPDDRTITALQCTLKFKTGNRIGSNPVLSELIRSFELQRPVQRSPTPKWDLSWVLVCLQKAPYEPLHKATKLHVTLKTAFLLALATAKR